MKRAIVVCGGLALAVVVACSISGLSHEREGSEAAWRVAEKCLGAAHLDGSSSVVARGGAICLSGEIVRETASAFAAASASVGYRSTLVVSSPGGDAEAALDIADEISRRGTSIVVTGLCLSACANYLFTAASEKVVLDGGFVGFHGAPTYDTRVNVSFSGSTPTEAQKAEAAQEASRDLHRLVDRQTALFKRVGVSPDAILRPPPGSPYDDTRWSHLFWEYGPRALGRFGVTGIRYFATPNDQGPWTRLLSWLGGVRCERDGDDAWLCST